MNQQEYTVQGGLIKPSLEQVPAKYKQRMNDLFDKWSNLISRNRLLSLYYDMKNQLKDLGISIPESLIKVNCAIGWCKKAIDAYIVRSNFDGFVFNGLENAEFNSLVRENNLIGLYKMASRASLKLGLSSITVMKGSYLQPEVKVRAFSGNQFSALWDKDEGRIGCGVVLSDVDNKGKPTKYIAHFPDAVLVLRRIDVGQSMHKWDVEVVRNDLGRPMMELMPYDPDLDRPLGHSMITPELQGIIDKAMRDIFRMEIGAEFFTFPQRYVLGASSDLFSKQSNEPDTVYDIVDDDDDDDSEEDSDTDNKPVVVSDEAKFRAYVGAFMAITRDENGDIPQVGQFPASPAENFTCVFENDAQRFSGATNVPLAQLGVLSNTYTSSDALSATNDPLILAVEDINCNNRAVMQEVARMMLAISNNQRMTDLDPSLKDVQAVFSDPAMPTISARADAWTKLASADKAIVGTRIYYERLGFSQADIDRILIEKEKAGAIASLNQIANNLSRNQ